MATQEAINIECIGYIEHIEQRIFELTGLDLTPMPRNHKDRDLLRRDQLRNIASWLDRIPDPQPQPESDTLARARALVQSGKWTKPELEALLGGGDDGNANE